MRDWREGNETPRIYVRWKVPIPRRQMNGREHCCSGVEDQLLSRYALLQRGLNINKIPKVLQTKLTASPPQLFKGIMFRAPHNNKMLCGKRFIPPEGVRLT